MRVYSFSEGETASCGDVKSDTWTPALRYVVHLCSVFRIFALVLLLIETRLHLEMITAVLKSIFG